jgi:DNA-binding response OmpR family regulator
MSQSKKKDLSEFTGSDRQKILIVDDKEANLAALESTLKKVDADVFRALSGQEALAQVLDHDFAIIILDVRMPVMDGYEVAGYLKADQATKNIPVIFVSAEYPDEEHIFKGFDAGAIDYMLKPYSPKILLSKVAVLLEMDRNHRELQRHRDYLEEIVELRTRELAENTAILQASNRELKRFNKSAVGRELRMIELKQEINALCRELGRKEPYGTAS